MKFSSQGFQTDRNTDARDRKHCHSAFTGGNNTSISSQTKSEALVFATFQLLDSHLALIIGGAWLVSLRGACLPVYAPYSPSPTCHILQGACKRCLRWRVWSVGPPASARVRCLVLDAASANYRIPLHPAACCFSDRLFSLSLMYDWKLIRPPDIVVRGLIYQGFFLSLFFRPLISELAERN